MTITKKMCMFDLLRNTSVTKNRIIVAMSFAIVLTILVFSVVSIFRVSFSFSSSLQMYKYFIHIANVQEIIVDESIDDNQIKKTSMIASERNSNMIQLSVTEEQEEIYRWSNNEGKINPTLKFMVNTDNIVQIQNPTDKEHEMIVQSQNGKILVLSEDIYPNNSGQLTFRPNMTGTFQYHCEYHPDTMKGIVEVVNS